MPDITAAMVKALREATGAGMMDCKSALIEADGDAERATQILREKGLASQAKRAGRSADQGLVDAYIHFNNTVGVLVEVNCETDFVANTDEFRALVKDLALQDRKSTRLNSSHTVISYAVFCLKKKKNSEWQ